VSLYTFVKHIHVLHVVYSRQKLLQKNLFIFPVAQESSHTIKKWIIIIWYYWTKICDTVLKKSYVSMTKSSYAYIFLIDFSVACLFVICASKNHKSVYIIWDLYFGYFRVARQLNVMQELYCGAILFYHFSS